MTDQPQTTNPNRDRTPTVWGLHNIKELLARQPLGPRTARDEFFNMLFGADNDGEWFTDVEWRENFGDSATDDG